MISFIIFCFKLLMKSRYYMFSSFNKKKTLTANICCFSCSCYHKCAMGICMEEYGNFTCDCDIGWTGDDCSIDCKCNGHSLCENGPGQCDLCLNGTKGPYCNECMDGHYGDPKTIDGELGKTCIPVCYVFIEKCFYIYYFL